MIHRHVGSSIPLTMLVKSKSVATAVLIQWILKLIATYSCNVNIMNSKFPIKKDERLRFSSLIDHADESRIQRFISQIERKSDDNRNPVDLVWETIRYEASTLADGDFRTASLMATSLLSQPSFQEAVIGHLSNQLATPLQQPSQVRNLFYEVCTKTPSLPISWASDLLATVIKDDSEPNAASVLLFHQGFLSLVTYRIANALWLSGRDGLGRYYQSLCSRTFGADIHPACKIGKRCVLSSGTSVVIGETAVIGDDCTISHGVTLGGTGKECGDRHPKIGNLVNLGSGSTVLGNIRVGEGAIVDPGAVVNKPVDPFTRVGGVPAKVIARRSSQ